MNWTETAAAATPYVDQLHEQSMRTTVLLFAFLGCVLIFAYVFLRKFPSRSPFRWIVALAALAVFVLIRAGGLRRPEVVVLVGTVEGIEKQEIASRYWLRLSQVRRYVLRPNQEPVVEASAEVSVPALGPVASQLQAGSEETLILIQGQAVGLRKAGETKIFLGLESHRQK